MEILINDLIKRLENIKSEEMARMLQYKEHGIDDSVRILAGKIMAIDYCINELHRVVTYSHQGESCQ
jgi:hypothetical protein